MIVALAAVPLAASVAQAADAEHGEDTSGVGQPPLDTWKGDLAIWTGVIFVLILAVLWKFAWGPIVEGLDKREQGIADQITQAEDSNKEARDLLAQYEQKLSQAKEEIRAMHEKARRDADEIGRELVEKAKDDAAAERQRSLDQIDAATAAAIKDLAAHSADLAVALAGKIVHAELKPDDHAVLIQQTMADLARRSASSN